MRKQTDKKLSGIIVPIITPFKGRDALDRQGAEGLIEHIIKGGVSGVFALGTTGEGPSLNLPLKKEFIKMICGQVNGRVPVLAGVSDTSFSNTVTLAKYACDCGAYAAVLMTPYFFKVTQRDLTRYIRDLLAEIPLPVLLYNIPGCTKVAFEPDTLRQLGDEEKIIGIKDSSGDIEYYREIIKLKESRPDWTVFCGPDRLVFESLLAGGDGGVNAGANIQPRLFVDMYNEISGGNIENARRLNEQVMKLYEAAHYAVPYIICFKYMLECMGICGSYISEPFHEIDKESAQKIRVYLKESKLI